MRARWLIAVCAALVALVVAGCGSGESSNAASGDGPERSEVIVQGASPVPNLGYIPMYVAERQGFLEDEGIEKLTIQYGRGDSVAFQALEAGRAHIVSGTPEPLILGYKEGLRGKIFYQTYYRLIYSVAVPHDSDVTDVDDLVGKKIGVAHAGSTAVMIAKSMLRQAGADPDAVEFVPVGTGQQALSAIESGAVDALALWDTPFAELEAAGQRFRYFRDPTLGDVGDGGYFTSEKNMRDVPKLLEAWTRAITRALIFIRDNPEDALRDFWAVSPSSKPKGSEEEAIEKGLIQLRQISQSLDLSGKPKAVDPDALAVYIEEFRRQGLLDEAPPVEELFTDRFLPIARETAARASGGGETPSDDADES